VRSKARAKTALALFVEEEDSRDSERTHAAEDVGYAALYDNPFSKGGGTGDLIPAEGLPEEEPEVESVPYGTGDATLEMGIITNLNHEQQTINLANTYNNPVVVMGLLSTNGGDPSTVRVKDVTSNSFVVQLQEWSYLDGPHTTETISWMVVEAGHYTFPDGSSYDAGITDGVSDSF